VRAQARGATREQEGRPARVVRQEDDRDRRRLEAVRDGGVPGEAREMAARPRPERLVEGRGRYLRLE
jgi:hypothetical protein